MEYPQRRGESLANSRLTTLRSSPILEALPIPAERPRTYEEQHGVARTIDELAELSGVSRATVSRVLNGGSVSEKTRRRVEAVLGEANYRPNMAARSLAAMFGR